MSNLHQRVRRRIVKDLTGKIVDNPIVSRALHRKFRHFDMIFSDLWRSYLLTNHGAIDDKLRGLCEGMDEISAEFARVVTDRYFHLAPACRFNDAIFYRPDRLFTDYELKLQAECEQLMYSRNDRGYWLPQSHEDLSISVFAMHNGLDLVPNARTRISGADTLDGGAFIGDSALAINEYRPRSIHCFEPDDKNCGYLRDTVSRNVLTNVTVVNAGLGRLAGMANVCSNDSQTTLVADGLGVRVMTIDEYCGVNDVAPALIKLDVEGMEYDAIRGGLETIRKQKPILIISIYHTPQDFFEIKPLLQSLDLGYKFAIRRLDPFHPTNETVLIGHQ